MNSHNKIIFRESQWKPFYYADHYRFHDAPEEAPLLFYMGGAVSNDRFIGRAETEPLNVLEEFRKATEGSRFPLNMVIVPPPLTEPERRDSRLSDYCEFFEGELLPALDGTRPRAVALAGNSLGSFYCTHLALNLKEAVSLVTIAGVGMTEALEQSSEKRLQGLKMISFSNKEDPVREWTDNFQAALKKKGKDLEVIRRQGEHSFEDYAGNGSIRDAFRFSLLALQG